MKINSPKGLIALGVTLASVSLLGLLIIENQKKADAFGSIVSVNDCQIAFLKGESTLGCDFSSNGFSGELFGQIGLVAGIIILGVGLYRKSRESNR